MILSETELRFILEILLAHVLVTILWCTQEPEYQTLVEHVQIHIPELAQ